MYLTRNQIVELLAASRRRFRKMLDRARKLRWTCKRRKSRTKVRKKVLARCMEERGAFLELFALLPEVRVTKMKTGARRFCDAINATPVEVKRSLSAQREFWHRENA